VADAFNQTEVGRQQGGKGTGLGLALVRQIVKLSGGRLGLKSKVGEGSTFWVELRESSLRASEIQRLTQRSFTKRWVLAEKSCHLSKNILRIHGLIQWIDRVLRPRHNFTQREFMLPL
jgi:hypothetical protein